MKIVKWLIIGPLVAFLVLAVGMFIRNKAIGPVGWAEDNTMQKLKLQMKDFNSMVIRSSYIVQRTTETGSTEIYVCGVVDGKNSFGGFTGGSRFASRSVSNKSLGTFDTYLVEVEDEAMKSKARAVKKLSPFESVYWNNYCVDSTHPSLTIND
jgi:hypothetical protein